MQLGKLFYKYNRLLTFLIDVLLASFSFLVLAWIKPATIERVLPAYTVPFLIYLSIWVFFSFTLGKYNLKGFVRPGNLIVTIIISAFITLSTISILLFIFKLSSYSRLIILGTIALSFVLEIVTFAILYDWVKTKEYGKPKAKKTKLKVVHKPELEISGDLTAETSFDNLSPRQQMIIKEAGIQAYDFFAQNINIDDQSIKLTATTTKFNIENINEGNLNGIVNLKKVNDIKDINSFFEAVNYKLKDAGMYVGCVETIRQRYTRIGSKYQRVMRKLVLFTDFLLNRVFPQIVGFRKIYKNLTAGEKRIISKAETLGRLVRSGFEIIEYKEIKNLTYFVVMKTGKPLPHPNYSYGMVYKTPRVGKGGEIMHLYKFRTMHPYSEYLRDYVLHLDGQSAIGKTLDDFRLTFWGKFLRTYWLDEIPQIINVLKGEMGIIGIRPLRKEVFDDYPEDVQKMRIKYKPGCIPPYISLLKNGMQESIEAERIYLKEKEKNPLGTDIKFFKEALKNIVSNKIKSA